MYGGGHGCRGSKVGILTILRCELCVLEQSLPSLLPYFQITHAFQSTQAAHLFSNNHRALRAGWFTDTHRVADTHTKVAWPHQSVVQPGFCGLDQDGRVCDAKVCVQALEHGGGGVQAKAHGGGLGLLLAPRALVGCVHTQAQSVMQGEVPGE